MIDLTDKKFGRLTVIKRVGSSKKKSIIWLCKCDCGNKKEIDGWYLRNGDTKSCGCWNREQCKMINYKHGDRGKRLYRIWRGMKQRCTSPSTEHAKKHYKDKGITVCKKWNEYEGFKKDMGNDYKKHVDKYGEKNTQIDRVNGYGNYELLNCRWVTIKEQQNNKNYIGTIV